MNAGRSRGSTGALDFASAVGHELHDVLAEAAVFGPTLLDAASGATVVLRYGDVERLAHDRRLAGVGLSLFDLQGIGDGPLRRWYGSVMFTNEGDDHDRLRRLVSRAFTPRAVDALRADAARLATESLAGIRVDGGGDANAALSLLAMHVMCRLLGVPRDDVPEFAAWADALSVIFGFMTPEQAAAASTAIVDLLDYVAGLVDRRRADPGDDLITALLAAEADGGRLTHDEVVDMVANLLVGGHDTTSSQIACTLHTLVRFPGELDRVRADPSLVADATQEAIRFEPSIAFVPRTAHDQVDGEVAFDEGSLVFLCSASANRDPSVWRDGDTFDVTRFADSSTPRLLSFGAGVHYCLGAALARLTVEESVRAFVDLGPLVTTEDPDDVEWRTVLGRAPQRVLIELE
jgi:cytochrome P450